MTWPKNITNTPSGEFRTTNGNADELIAIGRIIKAGFACSRVDITNSKYDAIIDLKDGGLLRIQIKGTSSGIVNFTGGSRSGAQISRTAASRKYKYTKDDCDIFLAINSNNGDCYIIPVEDLEEWGDTKTLSRLQKYKESWKTLTALMTTSVSDEEE